MLLFGLVLTIFPGLFYCKECVTSDQVIHNPWAPSLEISAFPDDGKYMLVGHNFSVVCTSNKSKEYEMYKEDAQPYEISMFYGVGLVKVCGSEDDKKEDTKTCTLMISNATRGSSGNYSCMAHNEMMCTIITIFVNVEEPFPPNITIYPMDKQMVVASGSSFNLSCEASGVPSPRITWFKDENLIINSSIQDIRGTSVLTFMSVRLGDGGHYWCEANNAQGSIQSTAILLTVGWKPYFVIHPENVLIYEGENVTLFCGAAGFPVPVIGWLKNNVSISNFSLVGKNSSLVLNFVKSEATNDKYKCVASNSLGKTFSLEGTLTVLTRETTEDNALKDKRAEFNPVWAWLGAVAAIVIVSTTFVLIRKYMRAKHNYDTTDADDNVPQTEEVATGYTRF